MAGAYGNIGAVVYLVIFSLVDARTFFFILAGGAAASFLITLLLLEEPSGAFADDVGIDPVAAVGSADVAITGEA
jgi:NNP family nitrate/nitrite transporter-like MFS transporter